MLVNLANWFASGQLVFFTLWAAMKSTGLPVLVLPLDDSVEQYLVVFMVEGMLLFLTLHLMCFEEERLLGRLSRHCFRPQTMSLNLVILQFF